MKIYVNYLKSPLGILKILQIVRFQSFLIWSFQNLKVYTKISIQILGMICIGPIIYNFNNVNSEDMVKQVLDLIQDKVPGGFLLDYLPNSGLVIPSDISYFLQSMKFFSGWHLFFDLIIIIFLINSFVLIVSITVFGAIINVSKFISNSI